RAGKTALEHLDREKVSLRVTDARVNDRVALARTNFNRQWCIAAKQLGGVTGLPLRETLRLGAVLDWQKVLTIVFIPGTLLRLGHATTAAHKRHRFFTKRRRVRLLAYRLLLFSHYTTVP